MSNTTGPDRNPHHFITAQTPTPFSTSIMRFAAAIALSAALCAVAAPIEPQADKPELERRGGYFNSQGQWVDDGYWCAPSPCQPHRLRRP